MEEFLREVEELEGKVNQGEKEKEKALDQDGSTRVDSWESAGLNEKLLKSIRLSGLESPSEIQAQAIPVILAGRDLIGIASTGSGKTFAFLFPMIMHIASQRQVRYKEGPIGVILCPTKEIANQTYIHVRKFFKPQRMTVCPVFGSMSKWEQSKALHKPCHAVVATPGSLLEMLKTKATNMNRVTFMVLDEADKMLDMGFEDQVVEIVSQSCSAVNRQTILFSATFKHKSRLQRLVGSILRDPVRISVGQEGQANKTIEQVAVVLRAPMERCNDERTLWLIQFLNSLFPLGENADAKVIVFTSTQGSCEALAAHLANSLSAVAPMHGGLHPVDRANTVLRFRKGETRVLVATDVLARGLDVPNVSHVVCFDPSRDKDTHVHRMGRTNRLGGLAGTCYSLVAANDSKFAAIVAQTMLDCSRDVPRELFDLACRLKWFSERYSKNKTLHSSSSTSSTNNDLKFGMFTSGGRLEGSELEPERFETCQSKRRKTRWDA